MKRLPPAMREKRRYLRFRVRSENDFELGEIVDSFWDVVVDYHGVEGTSKIDPWVIGNLFDEGSQRGIVRVNKGHEDSLRAALCMLEEVDGEDVLVEVEKVSGSLKKVKDS